MLDVNRKNISKQWEITNEILKRKAITKESVKKLITDDGKFLTKSEDICNEFNHILQISDPKWHQKFQNSQQARN